MSVAPRICVSPVPRAATTTSSPRSATASTRFSVNPSPPNVACHAGTTGAARSTGAAMRATKPRELSSPIPGSGQPSTRPESCPPNTSPPSACTATLLAVVVVVFGSIL